MRNSKERTRNNRVDDVLFEGSYKAIDSDRLTYTPPTRSSNRPFELLVLIENGTAALSALWAVSERLEHGPDRPILHEQ